jgi:hypothetical protein
MVGALCCAVRGCVPPAGYLPAKTHRGPHLAPHSFTPCSLYHNLTHEGPCNTTNPANWYLDFFVSKLPGGLTNNISDLTWK